MPKRPLLEFKRTQTFPSVLQNETPRHLGQGEVPVDCSSSPFSCWRTCTWSGGFSLLVQGDLASPIQVVSLARTVSCQFFY